MGRVVHNVKVSKVVGAEIRKRSDSVAVEEPLEIGVNGTPLTTTMRTPGNDI